ncbi:Dna2-domain-containing protein [Gloeopeniophorella convolvens]|nr:Dna2-domain-containing protein [Gloeopeniophorella convolvens]
MAQLLANPPITPTRNRKSASRFHSPHRALATVKSPNAFTPSRQIHSAGQIDIDETTAGWDWDALSDYVPTPKKPPYSECQSAKPTEVLEYIPEPCTRCSVHLVTEVWVDDHVLALTEPEAQSVSILLRDDWLFTDIHEGDILNIVGTFETLANGQRSITLTNLENLLVHHPDILLTPSLLASAPNCQRRPLVTALVRAPSPPSPALVYGTVLHDVLQTCLREKRWDAHWIEERVEEALSSTLGSLVRAGVTLSTAKDEILRRAAGVETFGSRYIGDEPKPEAVLSDTRAARGETALLAIRTLHDVEEDIWSPTYGLKGKLDASVEAVVAPDSGPSVVHPAPFEIKTGRAVAGLEHRAQTMLYTLLMQERYGEPVDRGLLYYTQSEEVISVPASRLEMRALVAVRNTIAEWMARRFRGFGRARLDQGRRFLPPTIDSERLCGRCFALDACMLYRRAVDNVVDESSPIADIYEQKTGHLTQPQADFFKQWERLIALEEHDMMRFRKELWTLGAEQREALGRCFADMVLDTPSVPEAPIYPAASKIHQFTYRFRRRIDGVVAESLLNGHMSAGDAVTVSVVPDLFALCRGFIVELTPTHVILGVDHVLDVAIIQERLRKRPQFRRLGPQELPVPVIFRIDKDEFSAGMGRVRENLASLFYVGGDTARLRLVVDLAPPIFAAENDLLKGARASPVCRTLGRSLNHNQMRAIEKVLCAEDYTLVLGMPGTGKTTVVAHLIQMLVEMGKTVLLSAYTHSAVDTILAKLKTVDFGILRLGNVDKVHPDIRQFHLSSRRKATTIEELERQLMTPPVVATTALSIDQYVRNRDARKGGLDVSLFRRLSEAHSEAVVDLTQQYRMNADIMLLSNKLIYGDRLRCGNQKIANQSLVLPDDTFMETAHKLSSEVCKDRCWLEELLDPSRKAVFVDTDLVPATESHVSDLVQNSVEAVLVRQFTESLLRSGICQEQIGVVTLYRQQIKLLSLMLRDRPGVEILTADRSQGRDKDCIIMSMVRANADGQARSPPWPTQIGDLVKDWRRMNVAFTRARSKLVIFGSRTTLSRDPLLQSFFELMEGEGWILNLLRGAHETHAEAFLSPQMTPTKLIQTDYTKEAGPEKRARGEDADETPPIKRIRVRPDNGILRGRPILRDVFNDVIDLT